MVEIGDWQTEPLERRLALHPGEAHTSRNPAEDVSVAYLRDGSDHYWTPEIFADEDD